MPVTNGRASSSPPQSSSGPITPGPRAIALTNLYHSALKSTLKAISYDSFAACFPLLSAQAPQALRAIWQAMRDGLEGFATSEFEMILQERQVYIRLNALDSLISDAIRRRDTSLANGEVNENNVQPPHTLPPEPLVKAHLTPLYLSQQSQLNAKLQTVESMNASLLAQICEQRKEITKILRSTRQLCSDVEDAAEVMHDLQGLGHEAREAEILLDDVEPREKY
ncbi:spindle pole protein Nnf1 [Golovinomyces cichoracearum]|uniref:Spindle pole protein Nnf1 n=1 Tax=Golovinomyces cichoracearum TaxID=62708 RepID=A0A420JBP9_9PEZI|nr:spindle pole protein Nnf1 [Golovinomyces cichoracearum]